MSKSEPKKQHTNNDERFTPPYPKPHKNPLRQFGRFLLGWQSWIHTISETSYKMKMGQVKFPHIDFFVINERSLVKKIGETDYEEYPKHHMQHEILCPLLGESIFTTNGAQWKRQRQMMNPSFAHTHLKRTFGTMDSAIQDLITRMKALDHTKPIAIDPLMTHITADVIFRTILSQTIEEGDAYKVFENFNMFQDYTQRTMVLKSFHLPSGFFKKKIDQACHNIRAVLTPIIAERYHNYHAGNKSDLNDILSTLLEARDDEGKPFPLDELVNQIAMLFLAGHETTASALTWSLYLLSKCPHMQDAIRAEIKEHEKDGHIVFESIKGLNMTRNVFQEGLRLYPPVSFLPREASNDCVIRNKKVAKGSMLSLSPWLVQRHRDQWKEPDLFDPERFNDPEQKESVKKSYFPFGLGPRICIGKGFAMQEAVLTIANIVKNFELENPKGQVPEPMARVTTRPKKDIKLWLKPLS
jgi:cytochrome P450